MTMLGRGSRTWVTMIVIAVCVGCGAPRSSSVEAIESVPYGLLTPSASSVPSPTSAAGSGPHVYLIKDDVLVRSAAVPEGGSSLETLQRTVGQLVAGPTEQDRAAGRSTALGADVTVSVASFTGTRATIDIQAGQLPTGAGRLPLAVGQLVLTVASVPDVDEVVLTSDGTRIAAPLPGGALTDRPLTAGDYAELLQPTPSAGTTSAE
ncbi:GerMN domain-containing protein [Oryzobacter terrae]|uniref:GerMN domain-containing protein n=1 Tax=Oryzobacter terrae TaxID=1620385 RepID=UPI00366C1A4A